MLYERLKVWVPQEELRTLSVDIANILDTSTPVDIAQGIHDEVAVARHRYTTTAHAPQALTTALGKKENDVPITLSVPEIAYLLEHPSTSPRLREILQEVL